MIAEILIGLCLLIGAAFVLLAALGLVRMPDVYSRMQSATKANSLGILLLALGTSAAMGGISAWMKSLLIVGFIYVTTPIGTQVLARAAHRAKTPQAEATSFDALDESRSPE